MSIDPELLPVWFLLVAFVPNIVLLLWALRRTNWQALRVQPMLQHIFYIACLGLAGLWSIRAGISSGLGIHFMGLTATTLLMGWPLALLAGAISLLFVTLVGLESLWCFGVNYLISVALPVATSYGVLRWVQSHFPSNPFIYIFLCGFFNGAFAILCVAISTSLMLGTLEVYSWSKVYDNYLMYLPLMLFPEAFMNGMLVAGIMGTKPELLSSFNVDEYFKD